jgi:hypothetical protein
MRVRKSSIGHEENRIVILVNDMIVAEHIPAKKTGATVADAAHLEAMWKLSLKNASLPPPRWQLTFSQQVAATPLTAYQEVAG